ncbi:unnamed protein product [marine sediment metagenome]|uniref:PEGA domain-containing protein n=1 Tax=marine sediment metagenome TaxID=412755 RepID=X1U1C6_9ZZZZ
MEAVLRAKILGILLVLVLALLPSSWARGGGEKAFITVLPLPSKDVPPSIQDQVLAAIARQLRKQYGTRVLSGRAVGRAVWGTFGSGLEEAGMRFTSRVSEGKQAYQQLQVDKTLKIMNAAVRYQQFCGPEIRDPAIFTDLHVFAGLAHLAQGGQDKAMAEFRQAVSHDPGLVLSGKRFPPDVVDTFARAKRQLLSGQPTQVSIVSRPAGAEVYVDGRSQGTTPVAAPLYPGRHFIRVELEGYSPWTLSLPDDFPPREIKALLVPLWTGDPPEDLLAKAIAVEEFDEPELAQLRLLAGFFRANALVLASLSQDGRNTHLGIRLFVVEPEIATRARLFNLGSDPGGYDRKVRGVVGTLKDLQRVRGLKVADSSDPFGGNMPDKDVFRPRDDGREKERKWIRNSGPAWYESWWFWTIVGGVVVAGGVTGLTIWLMQPEESWTLIIQPSQ